MFDDCQLIIPKLTQNEKRLRELVGGEKKQKQSLLVIDAPSKWFFSCCHKIESNLVEKEEEAKKGEKVLTHKMSPKKELSTDGFFLCAATIWHIDVIRWFSDRFSNWLIGMNFLYRFFEGKKEAKRKRKVIISNDLDESAHFNFLFPFPSSHTKKSLKIDEWVCEDLEEEEEEDEHKRQSINVLERKRQKFHQFSLIAPMTTIQCYKLSTNQMIVEKLRTTITTHPLVRINP